jgi:hypothetical protein
MQAKRLITALLPLTLLSGCAKMEGTWSLAEVDPTAARRDFEYESLTLQEDGTFYAEARKLGNLESVSGTWRVQDGVLSLKEHSGTRHTYTTELDPGGKRLTLSRHWEDRNMYAILEKRGPDHQQEK